MNTWYNEVALTINSFTAALCTLFATASLYDESFDSKLSNSTKKEKKDFYDAILEQKESGSNDPITVTLNNEEIEIIVE